MGKPMREAIGGGQAIIPSNVKIGAVGCSIDVPLGHKDDVWAFDQIDTIGVMVANAPRPDEIVVIVALADGGRPAPRASRSQAQWRRTRQGDSGGGLPLPLAGRAIAYEERGWACGLCAAILRDGRLRRPLRMRTLCAAKS